MKAQYRDRLLVISPSAAILLMRFISQMVMSIIPANVASMMTQYNQVMVPAGRISIKIQRNKDMMPAPINRPIAAIAKPLSLSLLKRAIRAIKAKIMDLIRKVTPKIYHGMNIAMVDKATPMRIV